MPSPRRAVRPRWLQPPVGIGAGWFRPTSSNRVSPNWELSSAQSMTDPRAAGGPRIDGRSLYHVFPPQHSVKQVVPGVRCGNLQGLIGMEWLSHRGTSLFWECGCAVLSGSTTGLPFPSTTWLGHHVRGKATDWYNASSVVLQPQLVIIFHAGVRVRTATSSHLLPAVLYCYTVVLEVFNLDQLPKSSSNSWKSM